VLATLLMVLLFSQYGFSTKISATQAPPGATRVAEHHPMGGGMILDDHTRRT
jgi:hypothetical protein